MADPAQQVAPWLSYLPGGVAYGAKGIVRNAISTAEAQFPDNLDLYKAGRAMDQSMTEGFGGYQAMTRDYQEHPFRTLAFDVGAAIPQLGGAFLASATFKKTPKLTVSFNNPLGGAAFIFPTAYGDSYQRYIDNGMARDDARALAVLSGAQNAALEYALPITGMTKIATSGLSRNLLSKANQEALGSIVKSVSNNYWGRVFNSAREVALQEGGEEFVQQAVDNMLDYYGYGDTNFTKGILESTLVGGIVGMGMGGTIQHGVEVANKRLLNNMIEEYRAKNPDATKEAIAGYEDSARKIIDLHNKAQAGFTPDMMKEVINQGNGFRTYITGNADQFNDPKAAQILHDNIGTDAERETQLRLLNEYKKKYHSNSAIPVEDTADDWVQTEGMTDTQSLETDQEHTRKRTERDRIVLPQVFEGLVKRKIQDAINNGTTTDEGIMQHLDEAHNNEWNKYHMFFISGATSKVFNKETLGWNPVLGYITVGKYADFIKRSKDFSGNTKDSIHPKDVQYYMSVPADFMGKSYDASDVHINRLKKVHQDVLSSWQMSPEVPMIHDKDGVSYEMDNKGELVSKTKEVSVVQTLDLINRTNLAEAFERIKYKKLSGLAHTVIKFLKKQHRLPMVYVQDKPLVENGVEQPAVEGSFHVDPDTGVSSITIYKPAFLSDHSDLELARTLLHESLHAISADILINYTEFDGQGNTPEMNEIAAEINKLYQNARAAMPQMADDPGFASVHEFFAKGLSDAKFMEALNIIPLNEKVTIGDQIRKLWRAVVRAIAEAVGIPAKSIHSDTALSALAKSLADITSLDAELEQIPKRRMLSKRLFDYNMRNEEELNRDSTVKGLNLSRDEYHKAREGNLIPKEMTFEEFLAGAHHFTPNLYGTMYSPFEAEKIDPDTMKHIQSVPKDQPFAITKHVPIDDDPRKTKASENFLNHKTGGNIYNLVNRVIRIQGRDGKVGKAFVLNVYQVTRGMWDEINKVVPFWPKEGGGNVYDHWAVKNSFSDSAQWDIVAPNGIKYSSVNQLIKDNPSITLDHARLMAIDQNELLQFLILQTGDGPIRITAKGSVNTWENIINEKKPLLLEQRTEAHPSPGGEQGAWLFLHKWAAMQGIPMNQVPAEVAKPTHISEKQVTGNRLFNQKFSRGAIVIELTKDLTPTRTRDPKPPYEKNIDASGNVVYRGFPKPYEDIVTVREDRREKKELALGKLQEGLIRDLKRSDDAVLGINDMTSSEAAQTGITPTDMTDKDIAEYENGMLDVQENDVEVVDLNDVVAPKDLEESFEEQQREGDLDDEEPVSLSKKEFSDPDNPAEDPQKHAVADVFRNFANNVTDFYYSAQEVLNKLERVSVFNKMITRTYVLKKAGSTVSIPVYEYKDGQRIERLTQQQKNILKDAGFKTDRKSLMLAGITRDQIGALMTAGVLKREAFDKMKMISSVRVGPVETLESKIENAIQSSFVIKAERKGEDAYTYKIDYGRKSPFNPPADYTALPRETPLNALHKQNVELITEHINNADRKAALTDIVKIAKHPMVMAQDETLSAPIKSLVRLYNEYVKFIDEGTIQFGSDTIVKLMAKLPPEAFLSREIMVENLEEMVAKKYDNDPRKSLSAMDLKPGAGKHVQFVELTLQEPFDYVQDIPDGEPQAKNVPAGKFTVRWEDNNRYVVVSEKEKALVTELDTPGVVALLRQAYDAKIYNDRVNVDVIKGGERLFKSLRQPNQSPVQGQQQDVLSLHSNINVVKMVTSSANQAIDKLARRAGYVKETKHQDIGTLPDDLTAVAHRKATLIKSMEKLTVDSLEPILNYTNNVLEELTVKFAEQLGSKPNKAMKDELTSHIHKLMTRYSEEIHAKLVDGKHHVWTTDIGLSQPHQSLDEIDSFVAYMKSINESLLTPLGMGATPQEMESWKTMQPRRVFEDILNKLDPRFVKAVIYVKAELEEPLLAIGISDGLFNSFDMARAILNGYVRRTFGLSKSAEDTAKSNPYREGGSARPPKRVSEARTYTEWAWKTAKSGFVPYEEYFGLMRDYLSSYSTLLVQHHFLNMMKMIPVPTQDVIPMAQLVREAISEEGNNKRLNVPKEMPPEITLEELIKSAKVIEYQDSPVIQMIADFTGLEPTKVLDAMQYNATKQFPGFAKFHGNGFTKPFMTNPVIRMMATVFAPGPNEHDAVSRMNEWASKYKFAVSINPWDSPMIFMSPVLMNDPNWAGIAYDFIKTGAQSVAASGRDLNRIRAVLLKGDAEKIDDLETLKGRAMMQGLSPEDVDIVSDLIIGGAHYLTTADALSAAYGKENLNKFESNLTHAEQIKEYLNSAGGLNNLMFRNFIVPRLTRISIQLVKDFEAKGMSRRAAARRVAEFVSTTSGLMSPTLFGAHGKLFNLLFFARGLTTGWIRQLHHLVYPFTTGENRLSTGEGAFTNAFLNRNMTRADMDAMSNIYLKHLGKLFGIMAFGLAGLQYMLSWLDDDDRDEHGNVANGDPLSPKRFMFLNEPGKRFSVRMPFKNHMQQRGYADFQLLREFRLMGTMIGYNWDETMPEGVGRYMKGRLNPFLSVFISALENVDSRGQKLFDDNESAYRKGEAILGEFLRASTPMGFEKTEPWQKYDNNSIKLIQFFTNATKFTGVSLNPGKSIGKGTTAKEVFSAKRIAANKAAEDQKIRDQIRYMETDKALDYLRKQPGMTSAKLKKFLIERNSYLAGVAAVMEAKRLDIRGGGLYDQ